MSDPPLIAYRPLKHIVKQEVPDEQEGNSIGEENWTLQLSKDSVVADPCPLITYRPLEHDIKLETFDEHQEANTVEEENWTLQLPKDSSVTLTGSTSFSEASDCGKGKERIRAPTNQTRRDLPTTMAFEEEEETLRDSDTWKELDIEEEEKSEHSSLEDIDESDNLLAVDSTDEEDLIPKPKAGHSKELTRQVKKTSHRNKKEIGSNDTAPKKRPFQCSKCEKSYSQKCSLSAHLKYECGLEPRFPCTKCDGKFTRKSYLRKHLINVHQIDRKQLDYQEDGLMERHETAFKCTKCGKSFTRKRMLNQHIKNECDVAIQCTLCKQNFTAKSSLRDHLLGVHNIPHRKLDEYGAGYKDRSVHPYKCEQCGRTYMRKNALVNHLTVECGIEPSLPCPHCDKRFKHKSSLKLHLIEVHNIERSQLAAFGLGLVVHPENQFKCDECGLSYKRKYGLKRHLAAKCGK